MDDVFLINQHNVDGIDQQIQLVNGHVLRIERNGKRKSENYRVNTLVLADKSKWRLRFPWLWLVVSAIVISLLLPGSLISYIPTKLYYWLAYSAGALIILFCLYRMWRKTGLVKAFYSMSARYPLVEIAKDKPSKDEFTTFVKHLEENIKAYHQKMKLPEDMQLAGEIRTLRRLKQEGIMKKTDYENAKGKLFKLF